MVIIVWKNKASVKEIQPRGYEVKSSVTEDRSMEEGGAYKERKFEIGECTVRAGYPIYTTFQAFSTRAGTRCAGKTIFALRRKNLCLKLCEAARQELLKQTNHLSGNKAHVQAA
ncbi:hypothetical protein QLX08_003195 [Tetragonisca angustula]|uniref:Uncharacterized protein n=1 Tax=Tetragonisca angustula TaxID=166442 RepID=A0AAW1A832_9HYME